MSKNTENRAGIGPRRAGQLAALDAWGLERSDQSSNFTVDQQYNENDPVGFEGQYGYYGDWEMPLASEPQQYLYLRQYPNLLTNRYYDPSTGKFASRDPIGTAGGENLYGYAGDDPVNEVDPGGEASNPFRLKPGQAYVEMDAFIPDSSVEPVPGALFLGDDRGPSPTSTASRSYDGFLIDFNAHTVRHISGTGDTHGFTAFSKGEYVGNSGGSGLASFPGSYSFDSSGDVHLHFNASAGIPWFNGCAPPIEYSVNVTLNKYGDLVPKGITGWHTAFPGFEIYDYKGASSTLLYAWDPHNKFDAAYRSHANYGPANGLNSKVGVTGAYRAPMLHTSYW